MIELDSCESQKYRETRESVYEMQIDAQIILDEGNVGKRTWLANCLAECQGSGPVYAYLGETEVFQIEVRLLYEALLEKLGGSSSQETEYRVRIFDPEDQEGLAALIALCPIFLLGSHA